MQHILSLITKVFECRVETNNDCHNIQGGSDMVRSQGSWNILEDQRSQVPRPSCELGNLTGAAIPFLGGWKEGWLCWQTFKKDSPLPTWLPDVACLRTQRGFQSITSRLPISQPTITHPPVPVLVSRLSPRNLVEKWEYIVTHTRAQERRWPSWRIFLVGSRRASRKSSESFSPVRLLLYITIIWIYCKHVAILAKTF